MTLTSTPSLSFDELKSILTYVPSPMGSNLGVLTSTMKSPWLLWQLLFDQQIAANNKKSIRSGILIGFLALGKTAKFSLQTLQINWKVTDFSWSAHKLFSWINIFFRQSCCLFWTAQTDFFFQLKYTKKMTNYLSTFFDQKTWNISREKNNK